MIYLTGAYRLEQIPRLVQAGVGVMLQPGNGYAKSVELHGFTSWAADNGCFAKGDKFRLDHWYEWLATVPKSRLLFAVVPDVYGNAEGTLKRSLPELSRVRQMGFKAAFVGQDESEKGYIPWDDFDCLFIGGSTEWKLGSGAASLAGQAKNKDMWVHMGRVNSKKRLLYAASIGCDSADGTFLRFVNRDVTLDGVGKIISWLEAVKSRPNLTGTHVCFIQDGRDL